MRTPQKTSATRSSVSLVSLLTAKYAAAGLSAAPPLLVSTCRVISSSGMFDATTLRIHSRKPYIAGSLSRTREFCNKSPHFNDQ